MTASLATSANGVHHGPHAISVSTTRWFPTPPPITRGGVFVGRDEVAMPEQTRAARNLAQDINHAHDQLKRARQDGGCEQIQFWRNRVDELLDRMLKNRSNQVKLS